MKQINIIVVIVIFSIGSFISCGGGKKKHEKQPDKEFTVTPHSLEIKGELGEYIKIKDADYTLNFPGINEEPGAQMKLSIKIKCEVIKAYPEEKLKVEHPDRTVNMDKPEMKIEFLDKNGMPLTNMVSVGYFNNNDKAVVSMLVSGEGEFVAEFQETYFSFNEDQIISASKDTAKLATFMVSGAMEASGYKPKGGTNNNSSVSSSSNASNENWDQILTKYEKFADDYIKQLKKINELNKKGDQASLAEVSKLMPKSMELNQQALELAEKLGNANDYLTSEQLSKFTKIQAKFTKAAMEMANQ